jgi:hypothetical protein
MMRDWHDRRIEVTGGEHTGKAGRLVETGTPPVLRLDDGTVLRDAVTWAPVLREVRP